MSEPVKTDRCAVMAEGGILPPENRAHQDFFNEIFQDEDSEGEDFEGFDPADIPAAREIPFDLNYGVDWQEGGIVPPDIAFTSTPGLNNINLEGMNELYIFQLFVPDALIRTFCEETNR